MKDMHCSFCQKSQDAVKSLISTPGELPRAYICNECIAVCNAIIGDDQPPRPGMTFSGTCLYVDDVPAVLEFYNRAFGFSTRFLDPELQYGELDMGGTFVAFASRDLEAKRPEQIESRGIELVLLTHDVPTAFAKAVEAGAVPVIEPHVTLAGLNSAYVQSVEGTLIGFGNSNL